MAFEVLQLRPRAFVAVALHLRPADACSFACFGNWNRPQFGQELRRPPVASRVGVIGINGACAQDRGSCLCSANHVASEFWMTKCVAVDRSRAAGSAMNARSNWYWDR